MQYLSDLKYPPQNYQSMTIDGGGFTEFGELFRQLRSHWVKVEFLQEYDETGSKAYESFIQGDYDDAKRRVTKDVKSQWVYEHSKQYNVSMTRIRVVKYPISRYLLRFEYHAYVADEEMGEQIFVVPWSEISDVISKTGISDYLVFDGEKVVALLYDEHSSTVQEARLVESQKEVARYIAMTQFLLERSVPLKQSELARIATTRRNATI